MWGGEQKSQNPTNNIKDNSSVEIADRRYHSMFTLRTALRLANQHNLFFHQKDIKPAYLNVRIVCKEYVLHPEGYFITSKNNDKLVWQLKVIIWS